MNLRNKAATEYNLGQSYRVMGRNDLAIAKFKNALDVDPFYTSSLYSMAIVELRNGNVKNAYRYATRAVKINPGKARFRELLSITLMRLGSLEAALAESQNALKLDSGRTLPIIIMAEVFRKKGENKRAIHYWKAFLEKSPGSVEAHLALIELYFLTGQDNLLTKTIDRLMDLKGDKNIRDFILESTKHAGVSIYIPDTEKILNIIKNNSLQQNRDMTDKEGEKK